VKENVYIGLVAALLLVSGVWHLVAPGLTERWMTRAAVVRAAGAALLVLAIPTLVWRGWYFRTLFVALVLSGAWRLCFPQSSIRAQQTLYPRWVHGCLLTGAAVAVWALRP
jgi:hypothetical protein